MITQEKIELWSKYENEIDALIRMEELTDELIFMSFVNASTSLKDYAVALKSLAEKGDFKGVDEMNKEIHKLAKELDKSIKEVERRAKANSE
jgi:hypothetical protein